MKYLLITLLVALTGFSCIPSLYSAQTFVPKKIVFNSTSKFDSSSFLELEQIIESSVNNPDSFPRMDSSYESFKKEMFGSMQMLMNGKRQVVLEVINDTVWQHIALFDESLGKFDRTNSDIIKHPTSVVMPGELVVDKKDVKRILGYNCYKVVYQKPFKEEFGVNEGEEVFEMYVTDIIKLPASAVINVYKQFSFFPLWVKSYHKRTAQQSRTLEAVLIER
jgi:hypothetical protein